MTVSASELLFYTGALAILFLTPGPVWVALIARSVSGGFRAAWPLAIGVAVGDVIWPLLAIFGVSWIVSVYADFITVLRYGGAVILFLMGLLLIGFSEKTLQTDSRLNTPGIGAGFAAGLLVIIGNPKAIFFYMGILPGFFDVSSVNRWDISVICLMSAVVPLLGNFCLSLFLSRARALISSPTALRRINIGAGFALISVGGLIALN